jgi:hypothetical protein
MACKRGNSTQEATLERLLLALISKDALEAVFVLSMSSAREEKAANDPPYKNLQWESP